jgi:hypothetical protein
LGRPEKEECGMGAAIYVRCSTAGKKKCGHVSVYLQNLDTQVKPLKSVAVTQKIFADPRSPDRSCFSRKQ